MQNIFQKNDVINTIGYAAINKKMLPLGNGSAHLSLPVGNASLTVKTSGRED